MIFVDGKCNNYEFIFYYPKADIEIVVCKTYDSEQIISPAAACVNKWMGTNSYGQDVDEVGTWNGRTDGRGRMDGRIDRFDFSKAEMFEINANGYWLREVIRQYCRQ